MLAGVLPTPAVALLRRDLGVVISASHNPPEYNGVKFFDRDGRKLSDGDEEEIEALLDAAGPGGGSVERVDGIGRRLSRARRRAVRQRSDRPPRSPSTARTAPMRASLRARSRSSERRSSRSATTPTASNINSGCGATDLAALSETVRAGGFDLGIAFDGDGDRMLAVDAAGERVDGDQIIAILALHLGVDAVAVTTMTNLGFHRLMAEHGIRVLTTDVGDRYVLEALRREDVLLGGEQSGHIIYLDGHVTGDGLVAAMLLCGALDGRTLAEAAAVMPRLPQVDAERAPPGARAAAADAARRGRPHQRRAGRRRPRARPSFGDGAARPAARGGRDRGGRESPLW